MSKYKKAKVAIDLFYKFATLPLKAFEKAYLSNAKNLKIPKFFLLKF
nr:hypothetical protein [uncultured Campylobacter sp.]